MKLPSFKKLNAGGASHIVALMFVVVGAGVVGSYLLVASHASTTLPIAYSKSTVSNSITTTTDATYNPATAQNTVLQTTSGTQSSLTSATYSPNHVYLAWANTVYVNAQTHTTVYVKNVQNGSKTAIQLPVGQYFDTFAVPIQWYPGSKKIAFVTTAYINNAYQYYLHTMGVGGSGLATVGHVNGANIASLAVSGDAKSLLYANTYGANPGIYSVIPGYNPVLVKAAQACHTVRPLYDGTGDVVYSCGAPGAVNIYRSKPGSSNAVLIHSYPAVYYTNAVSYTLNDLAPSPDGKTLAVLDHKYTDVDPTNCLLTVQLQISSMPIVQNAVLTSLHNGAVSQPGGGCKGGGGGDSYYLQWSPDASSITFLKDQPFNQPAGNSLNLLNVSAKTTKQLLPAPVGGISW